MANESEIKAAIIELVKSEPGIAVMKLRTEIRFAYKIEASASAELIRAMMAEGSIKMRNSCNLYLVER